MSRANSVIMTTDEKQAAADDLDIKINAAKDAVRERETAIEDSKQHLIASVSLSLEDLEEALDILHNNAKVRADQIKKLEKTHNLLVKASMKSISKLNNEVKDLQKQRVKYNSRPVKVIK